VWARTASQSPLARRQFPHASTLAEDLRMRSSTRRSPPREPFDLPGGQPSLRQRVGAAGPRLVDFPGGRDQADVTEGLGEVAEQLVVRCVDLLRQQAELVRVARELVEERFCALQLTRLREAGHEPERAVHEGSLL